MTRALAMVGAPILKKSGLVEDPSKPGVLEWSYRIYLLIGFAIVLVIPTYPEEPLIYFPALLLLAGAWLLTMPLSSAGMSAAAFARLRPPKGSWRVFTDALRAERIELPPETVGEEVENAMDELLPRAIPVVAPVAVVKMLRLLALRAAFVGAVGLIGILAGPALAQVHWWRGWSPVSILYGISAPVALFLLTSLLIPFILQSFLLGLEVDAALDQGSSTPPSEHSPQASARTRRPRRRRKDSSAKANGNSPEGDSELPATQV